MGSAQESGRKPQEGSHSPKQPCHSAAQCLLCRSLFGWKRWIWLFGNHGFVLWNERCHWPGDHLVVSSLTNNVDLWLWLLHKCCLISENCDLWRLLAWGRRVGSTILLFLFSVWSFTAVWLKVGTQQIIAGWMNGYDGKSNFLSFQDGRAESLCEFSMVSL